MGKNLHIGQNHVRIIWTSGKKVKGIDMTIGELLDAAKRKQGSLGVVADKMGIEQSRLSKWRSGNRRPDAAEILMLAELAELAPFETLAQVELELDEKHQSVWARALGNLRAAGVAATVTLGLAIYSTTPKEANAAVTNFVTPSPAQPAPAQESGVKAIYLMSNWWRKLRCALTAIKAAFSNATPRATAS
jgi:transcriptional regulator with XRE-family HTH domain